MELNNLRVTTPPRDAASVILLRDGQEGLEVFMLKRASASDVLGGAFVFPGGKLDEADRQMGAVDRLGVPLERLHALLGEPSLDPEHAAGLFFAAARETFEECGVLLAPGADAGVQQAAHALHRQGLSFSEVLGELALGLDIQALRPWSRWITPVVPSLHSKRFDTRFFVGAVPASQHAIHDDRETSDSLWLTPRGGLSRFWAREIELAPPQIMTLAHLSHFERAEQALAEAGGRLPPTIQPEPFELEGSRVVAYPGDPAHPITQRAMPGPTRLRFVKGRFEPFEGGLEAFFKHAQA
jgi:8-oxo-dGTP pyrophosphatase MutT (NUDIX family)